MYDKYEYTSEMKCLNNDTCSLINELLVEQIHIKQERIEQSAKRLKRAIMEGNSENETFYQMLIDAGEEHISELNKAISDLKDCGCIMTLKP